MAKRIKRNYRMIWVDSEKTAKDIEQFCKENKLVGWMYRMYGERFTYVHAHHTYVKDSPTDWCVTFLCTLEEWNRVSEHYNLKRLVSYKYHLNYELGLSR